jgi:DNA repair ATPase RecN
MRICDQQPMPKLDTTRYQLDPPPSSRQTDLAAWQKSIDNAQAQLEHQANRCVRARDQNNCTLEQALTATLHNLLIHG